MLAFTGLKYLTDMHMNDWPTDMYVQIDYINLFYKKIMFYFTLLIFFVKLYKIFDSTFVK